MFENHEFLKRISSWATMTGTLSVFLVSLLLDLMQVPIVAARPFSVVHATLSKVLCLLKLLESTMAAVDSRDGP